VRVEYRVLGPFEVRRGDDPVRLPTGNERALLAMLLLHANEPVSSDRLIDALWGEAPPPSAAKMVQIYISRLRQRLDPEPAADAGDAAAVLVTHAAGYQLRVDPGTSDLDEFIQLRGEGTRALASRNHARAVAKLSQALALWRGPALADFSFAAFAQQEIARLDELRLATLEDRIEAELALGRHADLVGELRALVASNPLRERLRGQLILALYRSGQQADALAEYRETRRTLVDELGIEPGEELQELERAILRHDPTLDQGAAIASQAADANGDTYDVDRELPRPRRRARWIAAVAIPLGIAALVLAIRAVTGSSETPTVEVAANGVGVIDDGKLVAAGTLPASPTDIAVGAGSIWVTSADGHTVSRIDPDTGRVQQTIRVGSGASGVAADDRGVWVANSLDGTVSRIDPRTDTVVQTIPVGSGPVAIALDRGAVWVASKDEQTLSRLDARTGLLTARVAVGASPRGVAVGADSVWVADEVRGVVFRVDPARQQVVETISVGNGPAGIAVGADAVWVANNLDGTVSRIDPERASVTATIPVGDGPRSVAVVGDGVWVSNEFDGMLTLIDPGSNAVTRSVFVGQRPQGIAAASPRLFVAVRSAGAAHRGGTLQIVGEGQFLSDSIDTLNVGAWPAIISTNDGLVAFRRVGGSAGGQLLPNLAVALPTPTDGGRTYTFRLRAGIRYSSGRPVQPVDFRRALERNFLVFRDAYPYDAIVGARECAATPTRCDLSRGVDTDRRALTVTFRLRTPDPDFLYKLALPYAYAVPATTKARDIGKHPLPATGPYMIASFRPGRELTLVRNPRFREWSKAAQPDGNPDRITWKLGVSRVDQVRVVERGDADVAYEGVPPELESEVETQYASQMHINPLRGVTHLFLNTRVRPFDDVRVRRAVNYAVDRAAAVRTSARGAGAQPTCQILPSDFPGFQPYCPYTKDPRSSGAWTAPDLERARRLVAESGTRGAEVTVWVSDSHRREGPLVARLMRSLGYQARLRQVDTGVYFGPAGPANSRLRVQAGLVTYLSEYPAASAHLDAFLSCRALKPGSATNQNWSGFCDRRIERWIQRALALQETDPYRANQLWARVDRAIVDRAPLVPLFSLRQVDFVSRRVGNYQFHPQWGILLGQLWVR
jgi:YVTN family beta-propeller protein